MPKFSPIPRLSIVVAVGEDIPAFENTLISVLENRPSQSEIIVAHSGNYDDPFSLSDEVEFVVTTATRQKSMIVEAAKTARGRIVHVIADGMIATNGWTESALEKFEHLDAAIVAPLVRDQTTGRIVSAGWRDSSSRLCQSVASGRQGVRRSDIACVDGAFLQASFWRRELLCRLDDSLRTSDTTEAVYAHTLIAREAGWRTVVAVESELYCPAVPADWIATSFSRGQRLRAIHDCITSEGSAIASGMTSFVRNLLCPSLCTESIGQATASLAMRGIRKRLSTESIAGIERVEATTIRINEPGVESHRRAA